MIFVIEFSWGNALLKPLDNTFFQHLIICMTNNCEPHPLDCGIICCFQTLVIEGFCNENSELFQVHTKNKQGIWTKSNVDTLSLRIFLTWTRSFFCLATMDVFGFISNLNNRVCLYILEHCKLLLVSLILRNFGAKPSRRHMVRSSNTASVLQIW